MNDFTYTFIMNGKTERMKYAEYMNHDELRQAVNSDDVQKLFLGLTIVLMEEDYLEFAPDTRMWFDKLRAEFNACPVKFFAPSSREMLDYLNDDEHDITGVIAPNRVGKSTTSFVKWLIGGKNSAIPVDPAWPLYREHGVKFRPFRKPLMLACASYKLNNLRRVIWPEMCRRWIPGSELGVYARGYVGKGKRSGPSWQNMPRVELECGTIIDLYTYEQDQDQYEGGVYHRWWWDEQGKENLFDGADERTRTVRGRHEFSLTPHRVEGRLDTGAGSWIQDIMTGVKTKGHKAKFVNTGIMEVPDWIYPESEKDKAFLKWEAEPKLTHNRKVLAEGRARLYGEWHYASMLVLDEWAPDVSMIPPLWDYPPREMSLYRTLDHGVRNPTACLWFAVDRAGNIFLYREYVSTGKLISENAKEIVRLSGNTLKLLDSYDNFRSGGVMDRYEEVFEREAYVAQKLDTRSFNSPDSNTGKTTGWLYRANGLRVSPASGKYHEHWVPLVQELLHVDATRKHFVTGEPGASKLYVFDTCANFKREIERYVWDAGRSRSTNPKELPTKKDDHCMNALQYAAQIPLRYVGNMFGIGIDEAIRMEGSEEAIRANNDRRRGRGARARCDDLGYRRT